MWSILALGACEKLINGIINSDAITRLKLDALHGQCLRVVIDQPQLSVDTVFDQGKIRLEPTALGHAEKHSIFEQRPFDHAEKVTEATATLHVKNVVELIKLISTDSDQLGTIPLQGDYHLLFALKEIIAQLDIDLASRLSPWIGATAAHELGKVQNVPKHLVRTLKSAEFMFTDSIREDSGVFASRWQMDDLQRETRQLNQSLDRLEAKMAELNAGFSTNLEDTNLQKDIDDSTNIQPQ